VLGEILALDELGLGGLVARDVLGYLEHHLLHLQRALGLLVLEQVRDVEHGHGHVDQHVVPLQAVLEAQETCVLAAAAEVSDGNGTLKACASVPA
jgi:hypothetical protein